MNKSSLRKLIKEELMKESVYKEGYLIIDKIQKASRRIYSAAADVGVPVKKNDNYWKMIQHLVDRFGIKGSREIDDYGYGKSIKIDIELLDEWAYSDERKTEKEALDRYSIYFFTDNKWKRKTGYDGFFTIEKTN